MSKTIKKCFNEKLKFINLYNAYYRICKSKRNKDYILRFEIDLETNIINILNDLKRGTYRHGKYYEFIIYEPKERLIKALPLKDRIVHQWYINEFIKPYIVKRFIKDTYSCIDNRGTHKAVISLNSYMRKINRLNPNYYVLKADIRKFFYSIDKNILYSIMKKYISDKKLLGLTYNIIFDNNENIGIPIGNYTSQYFANIYLHELDMYIKHELRLKYYVRYMDDFVILLDSKEKCRVVLSKIKIFLNDRLHLELNKKTRYFPNKLGIDFCGYKIFNTHILLRKSSKEKMKKKINNWNRLYKENRLDTKRVLLSVNSWIAHSNHACSYKLQRDILSKIKFKYK